MKHRSMQLSDCMNCSGMAFDRRTISVQLSSERPQWKKRQRVIVLGGTSTARESRDQTKSFLHVQSG
jgi:hypothetical protein